VLFRSRAVTGKPIKLIGTGEKMEALEDFHPSRIADRILGMGDIVSLVEKAAETIDQEKAAAMAKRMQKGEFDMNDLSQQLDQMKNLGGMGGIMSMLPGIGKMKKQIQAAGLDDSIFGRQQAIISSMTKRERKSPKVLNASRKKRVASGSGTTVQEINKLLKMHRQMGDMMRKMGKGKGPLGGMGAGMMQKMMGGGGGLPGLPGGMASGMAGGMPGGGAMPDLSKMDPKEMEQMAKQMGMGGKMPGGLPGFGKKK